MKKTTEEFWRTMSAEQYVVDLRDELRTWAAQVGGPVYGSIDAHWSDEGGVSMARELVDKLKPGLTSTWLVERGTAWSVPADLPPLMGRTGDTHGYFYNVKPDGLREQTRRVAGDFTAPLHLSTASGQGTYAEPVALLGDSFTYRALRYLAASFQDITVLGHGTIPRDGGRTAGGLLAEHRVVAVEVAERTLVSGDFGMLSPTIVDGIVDTLADRPVR